MSVVPFKFRYASMDDLPDVVNNHEFRKEMCFQLDLTIYQVANYLYPELGVGQLNCIEDIPYLITALERTKEEYERDPDGL